MSRHVLYTKTTSFISHFKMLLQRKCSTENECAMQLMTLSVNGTFNELMEEPTFDSWVKV